MLTDFGVVKDMSQRSLEESRINRSTNMLVRRRNFTWNLASIVALAKKLIIFELDFVHLFENQSNQ